MNRILFIFFINGEKHILSLRLTFCLSPQTQIVYFCIFWSIKAMLSSQCGLQYCRSSQHKKTCFIFPFLQCRHNGLLKQETCTTSEMWPLHFLILEKQPRMWFKMFAWVNLSITLYMCIQSCSNVCTSCCGILYTFLFFFLNGSRNCRASRGSQLLDHNCSYVCLNQLS